MHFRLFVEHIFASSHSKSPMLQEQMNFAPLLAVKDFRPMHLLKLDIIWK